MPALRALARAFPEHERLLAAPRWLEPLVSHLGVVDALVDTPSLEEPGPWWRSADHGVDVAVNLHGRGPQSTALLESLRPQRLVSFDRGESPRWCDDEHEVARWCRLLQSHGVAAEPADLRVEPPDVPVPPIARGATVVHPGAASAARRWPVDRWAAVVQAEERAGRTVVVTGGPGEVQIATEVAQRAGLAPGHVLAGRTGLLELLALIAAAGRVACGDTGVAHVATAVGTPSVVLFGPVPPSQWGPPPEPHHIALWKGRHGDPHAAAPDPGLLQITVDDVTAALARLPERDPATTTS